MFRLQDLAAKSDVNAVYERNGDHVQEGYYPSDVDRGKLPNFDALLPLEHRAAEEKILLLPIPTSFITLPKQGLNALFQAATEDTEKLGIPNLFAPVFTTELAPGVSLISAILPPQDEKGENLRTAVISSLTDVLNTMLNSERANAEKLGGKKLWKEIQACRTWQEQFNKEPAAMPKAPCGHADCTKHLREKFKKGWELSQENPHVMVKNHPADCMTPFEEAKRLLGPAFDGPVTGSVLFPIPSSVGEAIRKHMLSTLDGRHDAEAIVREYEPGVSVVGLRLLPTAAKTEGNHDGFLEYCNGISKMVNEGVNDPGLVKPVFRADYLKVVNFILRFNPNAPALKKSRDTLVSLLKERREEQS